MPRAEQSLLELAARKAGVRRSDAPVAGPIVSEVGRASEDNKQLHDVRTFDCFWRGGAALAVTVVVQHCKINGCVRSFFLFNTSINASVQRNSIGHFPDGRLVAFLTI
jgi:hypothetical protein